MSIIVWTLIKIQIQNIMFYCWKSSGSRMSFAFLGLLGVATSWNLVDMAAARKSGDNQILRSLQGGTNHDVTQMITAARRSLMTSQEWLDRIEDRVLSSRGWTPRDCADIQESGRNESGRYAIYPDDCDDPFFVYCDMETDRGGWTVFQRRLDGGVDFDRDWAAYKHGFGSVTGEHWLGNERIHRIASQKLYQLRIDMEDFEGETRFAEYRTFRLSDENTNYVLRVGHYNGDAGNGLTSHNNRPFTTKDRDNDAYEGNCAATFFGGWWYYACHTNSLNGLYLAGPHEATSHGVNWSPWKGHRYSLKRAEMKLRPLSALARLEGL